MTRVRLAGLLHSYTGGKAEVEAEGATVLALFRDLDRRFPGLAFRVIDEQGGIRPHMAVFLGAERVRDPAAPLPPGTEVYVVGALSGGRG